MIRTKSLISALGLASLVSLIAPFAVSAEDVIITVDVEVAMQNYYKVADFAKELESTKAKVEEEAAKIQAERDSLVEEFNELKSQATSDILTEQARQEALEDGQKKIQEVQAKQEELRAFVGEEGRKINARQQQQFGLFYKEIAMVVIEISEERSATLVIDVSARGNDGRLPVLYTDNSYDVTAEVIERINATQEEEATEDEAPAE